MAKLPQFKDFGLILASVLYIIFFLLDLYTTYLNRNILDYIELNPLYSHIGLTGIAIFNIIYVISMIALYKYGSILVRFGIINAFVLSIIIRIIYIRNAIVWYTMKPNVTKVAESITPAIYQEAQNNMYVLHMLPIFITLITFIIFKLDHIIIKKAD